jgi:hypothetical protein
METNEATHESRPRVHQLPSAFSLLPSPVSRLPSPFSLLLSAFSLLLSALANAQSIRGTAVDATGQPVSGAVILMLDDQNVVAARALTNERGEFRVAAAAPGDYRLRSMRIGFRPTTTSSVRLAPQQELEQQVLLSGLPISLDTIRVSGRNSCGAASDSARSVFALWEQARAALTATQLTSGLGGVHASITTYTRRLAPTSYAVISESTAVVSGFARGLWRSQSPALLRSQGYIVTDNEGGTIYYAPDLTVLISEDFVADHCFRLARSSDATRIGIAFEPVRERRDMTEIRGTMWFDRPSAELRRMEFNYTNATQEQELGDAGGLVEFARMAGGTWAVSAWHIRMPVLQPREQRVGTVSVMRVVLHQIKIEGGDLALVTRGRDTLWVRRP